jgi:hypothetical protein
MEYRGKPQPSNLTPARLAQISGHVVAAAPATPPASSACTDDRPRRYVPTWTPRRAHIDVSAGGGSSTSASVTSAASPPPRSHRGTPCDIGRQQPVPGAAAGHQPQGGGGGGGGGGDDGGGGSGDSQQQQRSYLHAPRNALPQDPSLRSSRWFLADELNTMRHISRTKQMGYDDADFQGKPVIAIINTWSDLLPCHSHFVERVEEVKRGVWQAGGFPAELPCMAVSETFMKPSSMLYHHCHAQNSGLAEIYLRV